MNVEPKDSRHDVENSVDANGHHFFSTNGRLPANTQPFIGRLGGNLEFALSQQDASQAGILQSVPDAAPNMSLQAQLDLRGFWCLMLWKAAVIEGFGSLMLTFLTVWTNLSPSGIPTPPTAQFGNFANAAFIGPLVGGLTNWFLITLLTYTFGAVSGAHLNPTITIATFFARLCSFPRMVLYVSFQTAGASLAGLLVRAAISTRDFKVGGCWLYTDHVPVSSSFVVEFVACCALLFIAFGVGLDPRQRQIIGPTLSPFLVGMTLGTISFGTGFTRYGHGGASLNPARCFGAFVGSRFPGWHWINWVADIVACILHGLFYMLIPPFDKYDV
ncbi:aquaporin-like protein [Tricladium varicosporioides]|nr:aquaporin-like protein [Hymenoscyphus varicosporioides]